MSDWRLRDQIMRKRQELIDNMETPTKIRMSKLTLDKLGMQMNMVGEINTIFSMPVENDPTLAEDSFEIDV